MPPINIEKLLKEDDVNKELEDIPFRFGYDIDVDYTLKDGNWDKQEDKRIWRLRISSKGAYSLCRTWQNACEHTRPRTASRDLSLCLIGGRPISR